MRNSKIKKCVLLFSEFERWPKNYEQFNKKFKEIYFNFVVKNIKFTETKIEQKKTKQQTLFGCVYKIKDTHKNSIGLFSLTLCMRLCLNTQIITSKRCNDANFFGHIFVYFYFFRGRFVCCYNVVDSLKTENRCTLIHIEQNYVLTNVK